MMVAMMLPSAGAHAVALSRGCCRQDSRCSTWPADHAWQASATSSSGRLFGLAAFPLGAALATTVMRQPALSRAVPLAIGIVVLIAGVLQFTAWKARQLACCRDASGPSITSPVSAGAAVATRRATRTSVRTLLRQPDGHPAGRRG